MIRRQNPIQELADLFGKLHRIFSDQNVQDKGEAFFDAVFGAADRELDRTEPQEELPERTTAWPL